MGILDNISKRTKPKAPAGSKARIAAAKAAAKAGGKPGLGGAGARPAGARPPAGGGSGSVPARTRPGAPGKPGSAVSRIPGKGGKRRKGGPVSPKERVQSAAAPLHDRRRRLVGAREATLRDLGGLMLEMYKRNRFREELLLDKCEEVLAIEVEIAHVDQRLFQLAPPNAAGMRPIGRCECGSPIHPGQNFCGVCGRSFATLTQARACTRCGGGLRAGDQFCATCGTEAPDALQTIEAAPPSARAATPRLDASGLAASAVAETVIIQAPPIDEASSPRPVAETPPILDTPSLDETPESAGPQVPRPLVAVTPEPLVAAPDVDASEWSAPPEAPDAAIEAAIDALPDSPTEPAPFSGFPLTSTVPPPPLADPTTEPAEDDAADSDEDSDDSAGAVATDIVAPIIEPITPPIVEPIAEPVNVVTPTIEPDVAPAEPALEAATPPQPAPVATEAPATPSKAEAKAIAARNKQRAKEARARAKLKAKAARDARKRGGE